MGWKLFEELSKGKGRKQPSEVSMIVHVVFVVPEYILILFISGISFSSNKRKIKNYPLSLKVSRNALVLLK